MRRLPLNRLFVAGAVIVAAVAVAVVATVVVGGDDSTREADGTPVSQIAGSPREAAVPELPFDDNPDPEQCGIPDKWGGDPRAWLTGIYDGELVQPTVFLYDSHLRRSVTASGPHGAEVEILLHQRNPVLDFYYVKIAGSPEKKGWVPAPFLSFDKVAPAADS